MTTLLQRQLARFMKFFSKIRVSAFLIPFLLLVTPGKTVAQDSLLQQQSPSISGDDYSLETPRRSASRHLYYLHSDTYEPELAAQTLSGKATLEEKIELATMLRDVWDAKGDYVEIESLPDIPNYKDSLTGESRVFIFPEKYPGISLVRSKEDGLWRYSPSSVARIPDLYHEAIPAGPGLIRSLVPAIGNRQVLGVAIWKWVGILLILGLSYLIYRGFNWVLGIIFKKVLPRITPKSYLDPELIPPVARPLSVVLVLMLFRSYFMPMLLLPIGVTDPLRRILAILMSVFGVLVFYRLVDVFASIFRNLASKTETTMDDQLIPLLARAVKLVVVVFGLLFILDNLDVDVTALLAGVSIGGLAIALAAQDTVKNFIGSISIFVDRPFMVGNFINAGDITGTVVEVGVRTTKIRALDGATVTVPNGDLASRVITNHSVRDYRRYSTSITVTYSTLPDQMEEFVEGIRKIVNDYPKVREGSVTIQFHEMNSSSLDIFYAAIFNVTDHGEWLACRQDIFIQVMRLAAEMSIDFAFPSTSVYIESMPPKIEG